MEMSEREDSFETIMIELQGLYPDSMFTGLVGFIDRIDQHVHFLLPPIPHSSITRRPVIISFRRYSPVCRRSLIDRVGGRSIVRIHHTDIPEINELQPIIVPE